MSASPPSRPESSTLPALAAVMVTALLLSAVVVGGGVPRMMPVEAVHAVLGTGRTATMALEVRAVSDGAFATRSGGPLEPAASRDPGDHARFLAVAASGPARGDLPPPAA